MANLLAYDGTLRLGSCCARATNRVRKPDIDDVQAWLSSRGLIAIPHTNYRSDNVPGVLSAAESSATTTIKLSL